MATHAATSARPALRVPLQHYANHHGHSGVAGYAVLDDGILVEFTDGKLYLYSHEVPGRRHVERMKSLADAGAGLSTYISRRLGRRFAARIK